MTNKDATFVSSVSPTIRESKSLKKHKDYIIVGSDAICDVQYSDPSISPQHIRLSMKEQGVFLIKDLNSEIGTFYGAKKTIMIQFCLPHTHIFVKLQMKYICYEFISSTLDIKYTQPKK